MAAQSGTSSVPPECHDRVYDVFLNFRGPDTRLTVVDVLYKTLISAGIRVFYDDEAIRKGRKISGELWSAITNSKIYIAIFSKNYASSKWCLREIAYMVDLMENPNDGDEKVILPVFSDVDASDVKLKTELYRDAMRTHKEESAKDAKNWKKALRKIAQIKGFNLKDHGLIGLADLIQKKVLGILNAREVVLDVLDDLVGIHDRIEAIMQLLDEGSSDVRFIVIHGMGGIGKTTLAKSIYNKIFSNFEGSCILSDIGRSSSVNDMVKLQKELLLHTLNLKSIKVSNIDDGINMISRRLHNQKVLVVLDDVDKRDHLKNLVDKSDWFGSKSRIIITTRNIDFLPTKEDYYFYQMEEMDPRHALVLFCRHAFENDSPPPMYYDISTKIVTRTGRLPLAIEVVGSSLYNQDYETWTFRLEKLKEAPHKDVQKVLMTSYDTLEYEEQQIFLDIACFFNNTKKMDPIYFWKACKLYPENGIKILVRRSLIKEIDDNKLWMQDQLRDLGRTIAQPKIQCLESLTPLKPSRLWSPEVALDVLQKKEGAKSIVALNLGILDANCNFVHEQFSRLVDLKFLKMMGGNFEGDMMNVFQTLRWLCWFKCPMEFQATNLGFNNLVVLKLSGMHITEAWGGWHSIMAAKHLKVLNLIRCSLLMRTPTFSALPTLERLILAECCMLKEIDWTIGELKSLDYLEISNGQVNYCIAPKITPKPRLLPDSIGGLTSLTVLKIYYTGLTELHSSIGQLVALKHLFLNCPWLRILPTSIGKLTSLVQLDISFSRIEELPDSIGHLIQLKILKADKSMVHYLPESIGRLKSLNELSLLNTRITELPDTIGKLKRLKILNVSETPITKLPKAIRNMCNLEELYVCYCEALDGKIPKKIGKLSSLRCLNLLYTSISRVPTTTNKLSHLKQLSLGEFGGQLPKLPTSLTSLEVYCTSLDSKRLSDLSNLANLVTLHLRNLTGSLCISQPQVTTLKMEWLAKLTKLEELTLVLSDLISPPPYLSSLSRLRKLGISCSDPQYLTRLPPRLELLTLYDVNLPIKIGCALFSSLQNVSTFNLCCSWLRDIQVDVLGELENLHILYVGGCTIVERLSGLSCLKNLRQLMLDGCSKLVKIQGLEEVKMLRSLNIQNCNSIQRLPNLSSLQKLQRLSFNRCESLRSLPNVANKETCNLHISECTLLGNFKGPYLKFLDQKKFKETIHELKQECGFYFDVKYFESEVRDGNWDELERYLSSFMTPDDNIFSLDMSYAIRKTKYLEALDRNDRSKAEGILMKDLKVFSEYCESSTKVWHKAEDIPRIKYHFETYKDDFKALTQVLTWENFREHDRFSLHGDTKSIRAHLLHELKSLIFNSCKELKERDREVQKAAPQ